MGRAVQKQGSWKAYAASIFVIAGLTIANASVGAGLFLNIHEMTVGYVSVTVA